jgi:broad specificity phosphatase PhoE
LSENYHFTFLRHGESIGNRDHHVQGQHDFPLSLAGDQQARELANLWLAEGKEFDAIISSPLSRAQQTAKIIQKALNLPLITEPLWTERHRGIIQGMERKKARKHINVEELHRPFHNDPDLGESDWTLSMRSGRAVQTLFSHPPGKYLVVTHGGILNKAIHNIFGIKTDNAKGGLYFVLHNTCYAIVEYNLERHQWVMHEYRQPENISSQLKTTNDLYRFVFIRHGESEGNVRREFQGQTDTALTARGEEQIRRIGTILKDSGYSFDQIIASPQERASLTAEQIAETFDLSIEFDPRLKEVDNGLLAGTTLEESLDKVRVRHDRHNPYHPVGETGESWFELYLRAGEFLDDLLKHPPGTYAVVSHGALLNSLLRAIMGIIPQPSKHASLFYFKNTGYAELTYSRTTNQWSFHALRDPNQTEEPDS